MRTTENHKHSDHMGTSYDVMSVISVVVGKLRQIVLFSVLGGICVFLVCTFLLSPKYTSYIELYANGPSTGSESVRTENSAVNSKIASSYESLLQTNEAYDKLRAITGTEFSNDELGKMTDISVNPDTGMIRISISTGDPYLSARMCNGYSVAASELIRSVLTGSFVEVLGSAGPNGVPSSPSVSGMTFAAFVVFFILAAALFVLLDFMDKSR